jgi:hypothetical protein
MMVVVMVMSRVMMMMMMVMAPMMMVMMMVMSPMMVMVVVMMVVVSRELHFFRRLLRPRGIIGLERRHGIGNRVQKFRVGTGAQ